MSDPTPTLADLSPRLAIAAEVAARRSHLLPYAASEDTRLASEIRRGNLLALAVADDLLALATEGEPKEIRPWCPACGKFCHEVVDASVAGPALRTSDCCEVLTQRRPWPALTPQPALDLAGIRRALLVARDRLADIGSGGQELVLPTDHRIIDARNGVAHALQLLDAAGS